MEASNKTVKLTSSQGKLIQYSEQSNLAFMLLIKSQLLDGPLNLDELMQYSLTPVPPSLGTLDGFFAKTNKASMLHFLLADTTEEVPYPRDAYIQDGMALWYVLTNLPQTCGDICLQVLDFMAAKKNFVFPPTVTMQTLSRHRRDCAVVSHRSTSLMAQPPGSLQTSSCSLSTRTTSDSSVSCCSGSGGANWQLQDLRSVGQ